MAPWLLFVMLGAVFYMGRTTNGEPRQKATLKSIHVISDIKYRFATTLVSMKYYNPYNSSVSADFHVMMPRNSFISNFSMEIDGNVTVGEVKEKSVAKNIYDHAVETGQSAGYIEVKHRFTNVFDISVNVEPQKDIVYNLTYQELLTRQDYKYRHVIHLSNGGIIDDFLVEVFITEPQDIIDLSVPEIIGDILMNITDNTVTNINSALLQSIEKHKPALTSTKKSIIIFLTDGDPTVGVTDVEIIKKNVREANEQISLFALCFGEDCDSKFLREVATENGGFNGKIYVDSDSSLQFENLYKEISNILLKDITFIYLDGAVNTSSTSFSNYFEGSELVVSGVLSQEYLSTIKVSLTMTNFWGRDNEILELELYGDNFTIYDDGFSQNSSLTSIQSFSEITEKTYAYITLQQLLKKNRTEEVRHDILNLALKYNFVTPLTSMVVANSKVKEHFFDEETKQIPRHHVRFKPHRVATTPPVTVPRSTRAPRRTPRKPVPILPHIPAILLKPLNCEAELCFTDSIQCRNQTDIVLLADRAAILIYAVSHTPNHNNGTA
ncbi:Hypothetical predicted protein [Octopus vulgaris]|uniref:Inter-alpha-trypsin inhibitor heavy chain H4-like n=1 Tax=Octopus vulgaris TaxID=6645 RepID=A0AA36AYA8_OCTVU|nr:Hypothetical predicted protein [Octopus vulgaris]